MITREADYESVEFRRVSKYQVRANWGGSSKRRICESALYVARSLFSGRGLLFDDLGDGSERFIHLLGGREDVGDIRIENYNICTRGIVTSMLPTSAFAEIVLLPHEVALSRRPCSMFLHTSIVPLQSRSER